MNGSSTLPPLQRLKPKHTNSQNFLFPLSDPKVLINIVSVPLGFNKRWSFILFVMYDLWLPLSKIALTIMYASGFLGSYTRIWAVCSKTGTLEDKHCNEVVVGVELVSVELVSVKLGVELSLWFQVASVLLAFPDQDSYLLILLVSLVLVAQYKYWHDVFHHNRNTSVQCNSC